MQWLRLRLRYPGACTGLAVVGGLSHPPSTVGAHPGSGRAPLYRARHRAPREPTPRSGCLVRLTEGGGGGGGAELGVGGGGVAVPCRGGGGGGAKACPVFSGPQQWVQPTASTLALWWLKFGPTGR